MNWGNVISWTSVALSSGASLGYFVYGDIRRGLYFILGAAITMVVIWK